MIPFCFIFNNDFGYLNLKSFYESICDAFEVTPQFEGDLEREISF